MNREPLDAYTAAYDALADTPIAHDQDFRARVARQIVDTVAQLHKDKGLPWLRKIGNSNTYYDEARRVSETFGPNPELMTGRMALWNAYVAVAAVFLAAYGRRS